MKRLALGLATLVLASCGQAEPAVDAAVEDSPPTESGSPTSAAYGPSLDEATCMQETIAELPPSEVVRRQNAEREGSYGAPAPRDLLVRLADPALDEVSGERVESPVTKEAFKQTARGRYLNDLVVAFDEGRTGQRPPSGGEGALVIEAESIRVVLQQVEGKWFLEREEIALPDEECAGPMPPDTVGTEMEPPPIRVEDG